MTPDALSCARRLAISMLLYMASRSSLTYTLQRKQRVLQICERVRAARRLSDCNRSHPKAAKCRKSLDVFVHWVRQWPCF
jgi:hypothetical protein